MHDPCSVAFVFHWPFGGYKDGRGRYQWGWFITIWHKDPEGHGLLQRLRRRLGLPVRFGDDSCDWFGHSRPLNAKERAIWEAWDDLDHRLGNQPYYPDLHPTREVRALQKAINLWTHRSRWRLHPRWHFWHWQIQVHPLQDFKRWAFSRCCRCGKRFTWGYAPTTNSWNSRGPRWFRGEPDVYHHECDRPAAEVAPARA